MVFVFCFVCSACIFIPLGLFHCWKRLFMLCLLAIQSLWNPVTDGIKRRNNFVHQTSKSHSHPHQLLSVPPTDSSTPPHHAPSSVYMLSVYLGLYVSFTNLGLQYGWLYYSDTSEPDVWKLSDERAIKTTEQPLDYESSVLTTRPSRLHLHFVIYMGHAEARGQVSIICTRYQVNKTNVSHIKEGNDGAK